MSASALRSVIYDPLPSDLGHDSPEMATIGQRVLMGSASVGQRWPDAAVEAHYVNAAGGLDADGGQMAPHPR